MTKVDLAILSGSGFYDFPGLEDPRTIEITTRFGDVSVMVGSRSEQRVAFLARHESGHRRLSNMINHRAHLAALKELDVEAVIATTVCGILNPEIPLGRLIVFSDLFFPENRLPEGNLCTVYDRPGDPLRGHLIFDGLFSRQLREQIISAAEDPLAEAVYAHVNGPRFNSASEVRMLQAHADGVSQTAGPEAVLAGELELPYALIGFGVDYANGVRSQPTPIDVLTDNLNRSREVFVSTLNRFIQRFTPVEFEGHVYRFE
jgi:5'-methylthioadenosine phosphorylase